MKDVVFKYFIENKHGYVTVMLTVMLISVLFLNTSFIEMGRYRSVERLYGEVQENAAFSILANYDRDLQKNFGLLAIDEEVGNEKFMEYLSTNLNRGSGSSDATNMDIFMNKGEIVADLQKLYFLNEKDVFQNQLNEFCSVRAPLAFVNNMLDLQETVDKLIKDLEESIESLESFQSYAEAADKTLDAYSGMVDYVNELADEYLPAADELAEAIRSYNEAIKSKDALLEEIESAKEYNESLNEEGAEGTPIDISAMEEELENCYNNIQECATHLKTCMSIMKSAIDNYDEIHKNFSEKFQAMKDAEASWSLAGAKDNSSTGGMATSMEDTYQKTKENTEESTEKMEKYDTNFFNTVKEDMESAEKQIGDDPYQMKELSVDEENPFNVKMDGEAANTKVALEKDVEEANEKFEEANSDEADMSLKDIEKIIKLLINIVVVGGKYNIDYQANVDMSIFDSLGSIANQYGEGDERYVMSLIGSVEDTLEIDISIDENNLGGGTMNSLQQALEKLSNSTTEMMQAFSNLKLKLGSLKELKETIESLKEAFSSLKQFFCDAIAAIRELLSFADSIMKLIYQKLFAATYATEMFSNRSTVIDGAHRMNGTPMPDYSEDSSGQVFKMANAEFIFGGNNSEKANQIITFYVIYALRVLANIPAILMDSTLAEVAELVAAIPYVGPVLALVLYVGIIAAEAYLDMIFMIYGEGGVSIIKKEGYLNFSGKGIDELEKQIEGLVAALQLDTGGSDDNATSTKSIQESWKGTISDAADGITKWDYKDHLFLSLCFFTSTDKMLRNEAKLIQMQMSKEKDKEFRLKNMATFVRTDTTARYKPLLPVPFVEDGIKIRKLYYTGY